MFITTLTINFTYYLSPVGLGVINTGNSHGKVINSHQVVDSWVVYIAVAGFIIKFSGCMHSLEQCFTLLFQRRGFVKA